MSSELVVTQFSFVIGYHPEDRSSIDPWNVGILPRHYTASQPRRSGLESSPPW